MVSSETQIKAIEQALKRDTLVGDQRKMFSERLEFLKGGGGDPPGGVPSKEGDCPDFITDALNSIDEAVDSLKKGVEVDREQVERIIADTEISVSNLGADVKALIGKTTKVALEPIPGVETEATSGSRPIEDVIISDLESHNNVYLYGGAGTGKTFIAGQIAKRLGCTLIEINCNQYTSPTELVGGQTIDGFVQGKLITAWANLKKGDRGVQSGMATTGKRKYGCLLLLDELPKIDPNTAGILNSALAKVKEVGEDSEIEDSSGVKHEKQRFYCIATGNTRLNEDSTDYVANFKQDLSLQDRFAGSTYKLFVELDFEQRLMDGYIWIWSYLTKLRFAIQDEGWDNQAFVSIRIMQSMRDTWRFWYGNSDKKGFEPKTVKESAISFFELFTEDQATVLKNKTDFDEFLTVVEKKEKKDHKVAYDSPQDIKVAEIVLDKYKGVGADREL